MSSVVFGFQCALNQSFLWNSDSEEREHVDQIGIAGLLRDSRLKALRWFRIPRMAESSDPPKKNDPAVALARYSEIGFIIPAAVLLGFFLGKLLDHWLHTKWLYLVGLLFGAVVGFTQMIRMALGASRDSGSNTESRSSSDASSNAEDRR